MASRQALTQLCYVRARLLQLDSPFSACWGGPHQLRNDCSWQLHARSTPVHALEQPPPGPSNQQQLNEQPIKGHSQHACYSAAPLGSCLADGHCLHPGAHTPPWSSLIRTVRSVWHQPSSSQHHYVRRLCSQTAAGQSGPEQPAANLKTALRRLYKRIHPDLFSAHPEAKAENERSFKLLQEYLHLARQGGRDAPASRVSYRFAFYLTPQASEPTEVAETTAGTAAAESAGLGVTQPEAKPGTSLLFKKVEVTLPPPADPQPVTSASTDEEGGTQESGKPPQKRLAGSVRKALTRLLTSCDVQVVPGLGEVPPSQAADNPWGDDLGDADSNRLSSFLPAAMEAQRLAKAANQEPAVRAANIRGAMRLQRKVLVSFKPGMSLPPSQQVTYLTQLAELLDSLPDVDLQGGSIVLGDSSGIDKQGNLCLDVRPAAGGPDLWRDMLLGVDMGFVREQKLYVQAVKQLEQRVAGGLGIKSVFCSPPSTIAEPTYRALLERLAHAASTRGKIGSGAFLDVPLCVMSAYAFHMQGQQQPSSQPSGSTPSGQQAPRDHQRRTDQSMVDSELAVLCVPDDVTAEHVYEAIRKLGPEVQACQRINRARQDELSALTNRLRTALHLRHLMKHEQLADRHYLAACKRLLELSDGLSHVTDGGAVRIGFVNRVWPDGSCIEIAHDFAL